MSNALALMVGTAGLIRHLFLSSCGLSSKEAGPLYMGPDLGCMTQVAFYWSKEVTGSAQIQGKQAPSTSRWRKRQRVVDMVNLLHLFYHIPFTANLRLRRHPNGEILWLLQKSMM